VVRIHNGVDIKQFAPEGREMASTMLGLNDQTVAIGIVGRLDPVKDHASLLQAFATIKQLDKPIRLIIVGAGPMRNAIESQAQHLGIADSVALLGERHDVASVMRAFDIFALSSIAEGISNTILEAMATGLPVVATKIGGNPELVQHEVTGRLVNVGDVPSMAAALQQYVDDTNLRTEHGLNSRRRAEMSFSLDGMAARYEQLYCDVLNKGSRREPAVALP
jgi:glycosyltransferase involved in cell wall biosynthesis